jgi:hypothetical protein
MSERPDPVSPTISQHSTPDSLSSTPASFPQFIASSMFHRRTRRHPGVQGLQSARAYVNSYTWIARHPILLTNQSGSSQSLSSPIPIPNCPIQDAGKDGGSLESSFRTQLLANKRRGRIQLLTRTFYVSCRRQLRLDQMDQWLGHMEMPPRPSKRQQASDGIPFSLWGSLAESFRSD